MLRQITGARPPMATKPTLRRVLTFWPLVFYGLAVIVGAGIYVALGAVIHRAGDAAPLSFLLAGITAGLTGLCYAELASRFPEASGGVAYIRHSFGSDRLAQLTGAAIALAVAIAAASIARGAVQYLSVLLPIGPTLLTTALILGFTGIAMLGVRESVGLAAAMGVIEITGLLAATAAGLLGTTEFHFAGMWPTGLPGWRGAFAGAFIAFFAFIGFETMANLAEEVKNPERTVPRGMLGAILASVLLYVAVSAAAVLADSREGNPLLGLFEGHHASWFAAIGSIAIANGVLVHIVMLARLFYGMANTGQLPAILGTVSPRTQVPITATLTAGTMVLTAALLFPFERLLVWTDAITLGVFALVDLALWRLHQRQPATPVSFTAPRWVPPLAALLCVILMVSELLD